MPYRQFGCYLDGHVMDESKTQSTTKKVMRGIYWNLIGKVLTMIVTILVSVVIVRSLGVRNYGTYAFVFTLFFLVAPIWKLGIEDTLNKFIPEFLALGDTNLAKSIIKYGGLIQVTVASLFSIIVYFWIESLTATLGSIGLFPNDPELIPFLRLIGLWIVPNSLSALTGVILVSIFDQKFLNIVVALKNLSTSSFVILVLLLGYGITEIIVVTIIVETFFTIIKLIRTILKFRIPSESTTTHVRSENIRKRLIRYAAIMIALPLVNFIIWKRSENYLIGLFRSLEEVGFYNLAYASSQNMLEKTNQLIGEMGIAAYAEIQVQNFTGLKKACTMHTKFLYLYALPVTLGAFVLAEKFIVFFYTEALLPSVLPFQILLIAFSVGLLGAPMHTALNVLEKNDLILKINVVSAVLLIAFEVFMITQFGLLGVVFAVLVFQIANNGFFFYIIRKYVGGNFIPVKNLAKYMLSGILMVLILLVGNFFFIKEILTFLAFVLIGAGVYLLGLKIVKAFDSEDLNVIRQSDFPLKRFILKFYG